MTAAEEFVPCRTTCQTCRKNSPFIGGGVMRWQPGDGIYPFGPPAEPYRAPERSYATGGYIPPLAPGCGPLIAVEHPHAVPRPVPRRPLTAGLARRLLP